MKKGFSLIELLIVFSIISILGTFSLHGVQQLIHQRQLDDALDGLSSTLINAQSHSRATGFTTVVCPSAQGTDCDGASHWSSGWISYKDVNENHRLDAGEAIIAVRKNRSEHVHFRLQAPGESRKVIFYRSGRLWPNGSFSICHLKSRKGKKLIISQGGRTRVAAPDEAGCALR